MFACTRCVTIIYDFIRLSRPPSRLYSARECCLRANDIFADHDSPISQNATTTSTSLTLTATSASSSTSTSPSHSSGTAAIAGGVIGGVAGLAFVFVALFLFLQRRRRNLSHILRKEKWAIDHPSPQTITPYTTPYTPAPSTPGSTYTAFPSSSKPTPENLPLQTRSPGSANERDTMLGNNSDSSRSPSPPSMNNLDPGQHGRPQLDEIIEGLAERFGWTAPPRRGANGEDMELPRYRDLTPS